MERYVEMISRTPHIRIKAILNNSNNEILFIIVNKNDPYSMIKIPVGEVLYNESAESTAKRIIAESTPYEIEPIAILGIYSEYDVGGTNHFVTAVFICIVTEFSAKIRGINLDINWLNFKNLSNANLYDDDVRILKDYRDWRIHKSTYWTSKII